MVPSGFKRFGHFSFINHFSKKQHWLAYTASDRNEAVQVIEATGFVEAVEVTEAAEVLRSEKSLLRISESSRFLDSALF